jgi:hypothetical protein
LRVRILIVAFAFPFSFCCFASLILVWCAGLADILPIPDSAIALIVQNERDRAVINDHSIRTTVFAAGGVAAARASADPAIAAAADSFHHACRRSSALKAAQGFPKPPRRSKAQRKARQAQQVQQAQALVAAAKATAEEAATEKRLLEGSQLAHDPKRRKVSSRGFNALVTSGGVPRAQPAGEEPIGVPAKLSPVKPHPLKRVPAKKSILDRITPAN